MVLIFQALIFSSLLNLHINSSLKHLQINGMLESFSSGVYAGRNCKETKNGLKNCSINNKKNPNKTHKGKDW